MFLPAFEQGALPFGIVLVSSFWLSLIFIFGFLSVKMLAQVIELLRVGKFIEAVISFLIVLVCVGPAAVFVTLFLQVLNDIAIRISEGNRWIVIWTVIGLISIVGVVTGCLADPKKILDNKDEKNI